MAGVMNLGRSPSVKKGTQWMSPSVSHFIVRFFKDVLGENGRERQVCQSTVEVDASSRAHAAEIAKQRFCETHRLSEWSDHADHIEINEADFPS